jgi:hypothetical protein
MPMSPVSVLRTLAPPLALAAGTGLMMALMIALSGTSPQPAVGILVAADGGAVITGGVTGLLPATTQRRRVWLTNLRDSEVRIVAVKAMAGEPVDADGRPVTGCLPTVALVRPLPAALTVPAHGTIEVELTVRLAATVQAQCRRLRFPLDYSATTGTG